jgi:hypothetical protein
VDLQINGLEALLWVGAQRPLLIHSETIGERPRVRAKDGVHCIDTHCCIKWDCNICSDHAGDGIAGGAGGGDCGCAGFSECD